MKKTPPPPVVESWVRPCVTLLRILSNNFNSVIPWIMLLIALSQLSLTPWCFCKCCKGLHTQPTSRLTCQCSQLHVWLVVRMCYKSYLRLAVLQPSFWGLRNGKYHSFHSLHHPIHVTLTKPKKHGYSLSDLKHESLILIALPKPKNFGCRIITLNMNPTVPYFFDLARYKETKHMC